MAANKKPGQRTTAGRATTRDPENNLAHPSGARHEGGLLLMALLAYAALGWRMLLTAPRGKEAIIPGWPERATTDPATLRGWARRNPTANPAMASGPESGVLALDVDGNPEELLGGRELPRTVTQRTGGGGCQFLYTFPALLAGARTTRTRILPGVDTRGAGGYIVVPPAIHPSGRRYTWLPGRAPGEIPLAAPPEWLVEALLPPEPPPEPRRPPLHLHAARGAGDRRRYVEAAIERECMALATTPEGGRNDALNRATYSLARFVEDGEADLSAVVRALTYAATAAGLTEREVERTIRSAMAARGRAA